MKEQILKGLLLRRSIDESDGTSKEEREAMGDLNGHADEDVSVECINRFGDERQHREELINSGAITPLDVIGGGDATSQGRRGRVSLMEHKIAEGMTVKLPRPRRSKVRMRQRAETNPSAKRGPSIERDGLTMEQTHPRPHEALVDPLADVLKLNKNEGLSTFDDAEGQCQKCSNRQEDAPVCSACFETSKESPTTTARRCGSVSGVTEAQERRQSTSERSNAHTVECPTCEQFVRVDDPAHPCTSLSKHMDRCTRRRGRARASGQAKDEKDFGKESSPRRRSLLERRAERKRSGEQCIRSINI